MLQKKCDMLPPGRYCPGGICADIPKGSGGLGIRPFCKLKQNERNKIKILLRSEWVYAIIDHTGAEIRVFHRFGCVHEAFLHS